MKPSTVLCQLAPAFLIGSVIAQDALGLSNGYTPFQFGRFRGKIVKSSQTLASLTVADTGFDFLPSDVLYNLSINGAHHLGDITLRYRTSNSSSWMSLDSASARKPVTLLKDNRTGAIAASDMEPTLDLALPFRVTKEWVAIGDDLALRINITNGGNLNLEIGSLGLPVSINNIFTNRPAAETQENCSFADPYVGLDAGYVRVSPLKGTGNALVIVPLDTSPLEAWRFLHEPIGSFGYQSQTFEGNYEWQIHSLAYAQNEWNGSKPWNIPTSKIIQPGETYSVGLRLALADSIQNIEDTVIRTGTPLVVGVPGYIIPQDTTARIYINHTTPVKWIDTADAFTQSLAASSGEVYELKPTAAWGRARVTLNYADNKTQTIHYYISKPAPSALADLGYFFTNSALFNDTSDAFHRAPSLMTYDREAKKIVEQEGRVWIAGLSDEGGAGTYLATAMKQFVQPVATELAILDSFIHDTLVGTIQQNGTFGVVASTFFFDLKAVPGYDYSAEIDWTTWTSWDRSRAHTTVRAYNYIHPTAAYWAMYRIARQFPEHKLRSEWEWYLGRAYSTSQYCLSNQTANCEYGLVGLMGETVLGELLEDLKREGRSAQVSALETTMKYRAALWDTQAVPFGSEMAWDSTGQEGVYYWSKYVFTLLSSTSLH
jgi:hypothetical protein